MREPFSNALIIKVLDYALEESKFATADKIFSNICDFLAKEYVSKNGEALLAAVDVKAVTNTLAIKIAEELTSKILKKEEK